MSHYTFTATDSTGRTGTVHVDPAAPIHGHCGWFSLDVDPGTGSMSGSRALMTLTITGGPKDGLEQLAAWSQQYADRTSWLPQHRQWADAVTALTERI